MLNRRAYRRTRVERSVEVVPRQTGRRSRWLFATNKPPAPAVGKLLDIGCGGMAAEFPAKFEVGTGVDVHIEGTGGKVQRTRGTIRNVRGDNGIRTVGIAFTEPILALGDPARGGRPLGTEGVEPAALVVDDDPGVHQILQRFLRGRGFRVTAVSSAEEALELLRHQQPALMMLDLKMDGMTGVQLLETMTAEGLRVPNVWAMSGSASDEEALSALSLGAGEFMNKPFDLDHLDYSLQLLSPML